MGIACFFIEPTDRVQLYLRCYGDGPCAKQNMHPNSYHNVMIPLYEATRRKVPASDGDWEYQDDAPRVDDVPATYTWPTVCECGVTMVDPIKQVFADHIYRRVDTGELRGLRQWDQVPGAMWNAEWLAEYPRYRGEDGRSLHVVCPDGWPWAIDGPCSNCTMPSDTTHKCWVRHGEPPLITVDKNGVTCAAGAGSIQTPTWHGFLRNGILEPA